MLDSERLLDRKQEELEKRKAELEGSRAAVTDMETRRDALESDSENLKTQLNEQLVDEASGGKLPPMAIAEKELERAKNALVAFEAEGDVVPSLRDYAAT